MPIEVMIGVSKNPNQEEITSYGYYVDILREQMQQAHDIAWKYLGKCVSGASFLVELS